ncbi:hypothetical protein D3C76_1281490 [compost metagenome]
MALFIKLRRKQANGRFFVAPCRFFQQPQHFGQGTKTQGIAAAGQTVRQVRNLGAVVGINGFAQRLTMLMDRVAQQYQKSLHFLFAEQAAVGLQQRPVHAAVIRQRFGCQQLPAQHLAQIVQFQRLGQHAVHAGIQILADQRRLHTGGQGENARSAVRSVATANPFAQLHTAHARQMHVEQNKIESLRGALHQRLFTVFGQPHLMAVALQ